MPSKLTDGLKRYKREYADKNPEKNREAVLKYRKTDKFKRARKKYQVENKERLSFIAKRSYVKRYFGISIEEYNAKIENAQGLCEICLQVPPRGMLHLDHNHKTSKHRGVLCFNCNVALGYLKEDIERIKNMISYIQKYE